MRVVFEGADMFKKAIAAITALVDEGIFTFDDEGMKLRATDPSKIAMVDFILPKSAFREYNIMEPTKVAVDLDDMESVLKRAKATEDVILETQDGRLNITLVGRARKKFSLPLLDIPEESLPQLNVTFDVTAKVVAEVLQTALKDASLFSTYVTFSADETGLKVKAVGTKGEYELEIPRDQTDTLIELSVGAPATASFALDYLTDMLAGASKTSAVNLHLKTDRPLKLVYSIGEAVVTYYLAPKIGE